MKKELRLSDIETGEHFRLATSTNDVMTKLSDIIVDGKKLFRYRSYETGVIIETKNDYFIFDY